MKFLQGVDVKIIAFSGEILNIAGGRELFGKEQFGRIGTEAVPEEGGEKDRERKGP